MTSNPNTIMRDETIPEDIFEAATAACGFNQHAKRGTGTLVYSVALAILAERAAENERCAKTAANIAAEYTEISETRTANTQRMAASACAFAASRVASSIRSSHE